MRPSGLGQFWGAEFENGWYTGVGRSFQPHFCNLKSRSGKNSLKVNKAKRRGTLVNKDDLRYFVLLSIVTAVILPVGVVYGLVFMLEQLGFAKFGLYIESKTNKHISIDA